MEFNQTEFMKQQFEPRTARVAVPTLAKWFKLEDGEAAEWEVRGLTGNEVGRLHEIEDNHRNMVDVVRSLSNNQSVVNELKKAVGISDDVPLVIMKRLEQLTMGSVNPKIDLPVAVKLCETYPVQFMVLTNKITDLTGLGLNEKK